MENIEPNLFNNPEFSERFWELHRRVSYRLREKDDPAFVGRSREDLRGDFLIALERAYKVFADTPEISQQLPDDRCDPIIGLTKIKTLCHQVLIETSGDKEKTAQNIEGELKGEEPAETGQNDKTVEELKGPETIRLTDFLRHYCETQGIDLDSKKRYIQRIAQEGRIALAKPVNAQGRKTGQPYLYDTAGLLEAWPLCCQRDVNIPKLKSNQKPR